MSTPTAPAVPAVPRAQSRREANKARTRQALIDAALALFADRGFERTSVEDVAAAAGVSPRTFFRYFASKEDVLFFGEYDYVRSFTGVYLAQPASLSEWDAIRASFLVLAPALARIKGRVARYEAAVASSPLLRGREQVHQLEHRAVIAAAIARRRDVATVDDDCRLVATVALTVLRHSFDRWLSAPAADPRPFVEADFASLAAALAL